MLDVQSSMSGMGRQFLNSFKLSVTVQPYGSVSGLSGARKP